MDEILPVIFWLTIVQSELELSVSRQVSVVRVVQVLGNSKNEWIVEFIELVVREFDIVFNAISVQIGNSSSPSLSGLGSLEEFQILWALNIFDVESEFVGSGGFHLNVLRINIIHGHGHWFSLLAQSINVDFRFGLGQEAGIESIGGSTA